MMTEQGSDPGNALTPHVKDKRIRKMFRFWLNALNDDDARLIYYCTEQKRTRQFQRTIRQALRLYWNLQEGYVDFLLHWFPDIQERLNEHYREQGK